MTFPFQSCRPRQQMSLDSVANWPTRTVGPGARVERWRNRCPSSPAKYLTWADVIDHHVVGFVQTSCQHSTKHKCTNCQKLFQYHEWLNCTKLTSSEWGGYMRIHVCAEMLALPLSKELLLLASPRKTTTMPQAVSTSLRSLDSTYVSRFLVVSVFAKIPKITTITDREYNAILQLGNS